MTLKEAADKFIELTIWIRELSSPQLTDVDNAESYREKLLINFRRIGDIAQINNALMEEHLAPLLKSEHLLSEEEISVLQDLKEKLLDAYAVDNLDIPFLYQVAQRLREDAERKKDKERIIRSLDDYVMTAYALLAMVRRIYPYCDSAINCRKEGLKAAEGILEYLPTEKLETLSDEFVRELVLIDSRYTITFYEYPLTREDAALAEDILQLLRRSLTLKDLPEYRRLVPDYDWTYHEFRTLQYFSALVSFNNTYGFSQEQLAELNGYAKGLWKIWEENPELREHNREETIRFIVARCAYLAGETDRETFKKEMRKLATKVRKDSYDADEMQFCTSVPIEYILTLDPQNISKIDAETLAGFYRRMIRYIHRMPKRGHLSFLLSELAYLLCNFIEVEGGIDFETMCMELLAAIHPPTYVHSMSVADLSACLARHLFRKHPEVFEKTPGYPDLEAVEEHVWHAAACHDIGKLFIVETIITYGRPLYDREFDWIRAHTEAGAALLSKHERTKDYAEVARGHQRWYDGKGGYPESYDPEKATNRIVVDIVSCADCMDAATDSVGRSYKQGKTLDEFMEELKEGCGTRYAPFILELLEDETVYSELDSILSDGRDDKYRRTYTLLDNVLRNDN